MRESRKPEYLSEEATLQIQAVSSNQGQPAPKEHPQAGSGLEKMQQTLQSVPLHNGF